MRRPKAPYTPSLPQDRHDCGIHTKSCLRNQLADEMTALATYQLDYEQEIEWLGFIREGDYVEMIFRVKPT